VKTGGSRIRPYCRRSRRTAHAAEEDANEHAKNETADVSPNSDTVRFSRLTDGTDAGVELYNEPETQKEDSGNSSDDKRER
jgi:hypothetical protein